MSNYNPYSIMFGQEPQEYIPREDESNMIIDAFTTTGQSQKCYMISGLRGTGKTVFVDSIKSKLLKDPNWITIELNSSTPLLEDLASKLASNNSFMHWFHEAKLNLSAFGFGLEISHVAPIVNLETAIIEMLKTIQKHNRHLLIIIDEATNSPSMRQFATSFQIFLREKLPVYLLMTGLYENIKNLKDEQNLTFLYRSPTIYLQPLNTLLIQQNYEKLFNISSEVAKKMAIFTKGYSFAFQALGYETWKANGFSEKALTNYKKDLFEYSYSKIWSELSNQDKKIIYGLAQTKDGKYSDLLEKTGLDKNHLNPYRKRLLDKGLIISVSRGQLAFVLPFFGEYAIETYEDDLYYTL